MTAGNVATIVLWVHFACAFSATLAAILAGVIDGPLSALGRLILWVTAVPPRAAATALFWLSVVLVPLSIMWPPGYADRSMGAKVFDILFALVLPIALRIIWVRKMNAYDQAARQTGTALAVPRGHFVHYVMVGVLLSGPEAALEWATGAPPDTWGKTVAELVAWTTIVLALVIRDHDRDPGLPALLRRGAGAFRRWTDSTTLPLPTPTG